MLPSAGGIVAFLNLPTASQPCGHQVLGFLPWLAPFLLRSRRLRARLDMVPLPRAVVVWSYRSSHVVDLARH